MPDGINTPVWVDWLLALGIAAGALTAVVKAWTGVVVPYLFSPLVGAVEKAVTGIVTEHIEPIHHELRTNGGSSLKDAVLRIEEDQKRIRGHLHAIGNHLSVTALADPILQDVLEELHAAEDTSDLKRVKREFGSG